MAFPARPATVRVFGAIFFGTNLADQFQKGCSMGSHNDFPLDLYVCSEIRATSDFSNGSPPKRTVILLTPRPFSSVQFSQKRFRLVSSECPESLHCTHSGWAATPSKSGSVRPAKRNRQTTPYLTLRAKDIAGSEPSQFKSRT